ncbi:MAG: ParD-like family protein [Actinobacteria bacterium]|nr:ParD-like family protein [Actinomycetota bacterium]
MSMPVRIDPELYALARAEAAIEHRTIAGQIEYWAKIGRTALDNPDLPINFIVDVVASLAEPAEYETPYSPNLF